MGSISPLVARYVASTYPAELQPGVLERLAALREPPCGPGWAETRERVQMGVLLVARGTQVHLESALALAALDWRDLLVAAGLANADWPAVLQRAVDPEVPQNEA